MGTYWKIWINDNYDWQWEWDDEARFGRPVAAPGDRPLDSEFEAAESYFENGGGLVFHSIRAKTVGLYAAHNSVGDAHLAGMSPFPVISLGGNLYVPKSANQKAGLYDFGEDNLELGGFGAHYVSQFDQLINATSLYNLGLGAAGNSAAGINLTSGALLGVDAQTTALARALASYASTPAGQQAGAKVGALAYVTIRFAKGKYGRIAAKFVGDMAERFNVAERFQRSVIGEFAEDLGEIYTHGSGNKTYITYGAVDAQDNVVYVGKASGLGTPQQVLNRRLGNHFMIKKNKFTKGQFEILDTQKAYGANRGAEDVYYNYHRIKNEKIGLSFVNRPGSRSSMYNKNAPIGPRNSNGRAYVNDYVSDPLSTFPDD